MKQAKQLGLLFRTLRHLKAEQLYFQLYYRLCAKVGIQRPANVAALAANYKAWSETVDCPRPCNTDAFAPEQLRFCFINLEHSFDDRIEWSGGPHGKLWDYNLHYFEWLWGLQPETAKSLVLDWIDRHPYHRGAVGWEPYPLSLRIINWVGYWATQGRACLEGDPDFSESLFQSLGMQCDWLTKRLEKHILGNHYLENGVALRVAGTFFEGSVADQWRQIGNAILKEQLGEQIMADGMHFERSPMYHNRLVHLLEWLCVAPSADLSLDVHALLEKTQRAALKLRHPDGRIALFNDSAFGIYPELVGDCPSGAFALEDAGYYGVRTQSGDYWICDAGRIGPDYLPGHAHCDIGSFELSLNGNRWITDTGVYQYETSEKRYYSRSTAAHNTFGPQGVEQAEIWSSFRVGDRPDVVVHEWTTTKDGDAVLELSHDGFERALKDKANYRRRMEFSAKQILRITDRFDSSALLKWEGRLHFAPGVELLEHIGHRVVLQSGKERLQVTLKGVDEVTIRETPYWPEFNTTHKRQTLIYSRLADAGEVRVVLDWTGVTV